MLNVLLFFGVCIIDPWSNRKFAFVCSNKRCSVQNMTVHNQALNSHCTTYFDLLNQATLSGGKLHILSKLYSLSNVLTLRIGYKMHIQGQKIDAFTRTIFKLLCSKYEKSALHAHLCCVQMEC